MVLSRHIEVGSGGKPAAGTRLFVATSSASRNQKQIPRLHRAAADLRRQFKDARGFARNDKFLGWHKLGAFLGG
jgi:hypothetical protein